MIKGGGKKSTEEEGGDTDKTTWLSPDVVQTTVKS